MDSYRSPASVQSSVNRRAGALPRILAITLALSSIGPLSAFAQEPANAGPAVPATTVTLTRSVTQEREGFLFRPPVVRIGMRAGFNFARAASGIFDLATEQLTVDRGDFGGFTVAGDLAIRVTDPLDIVLSAGHAASSTRSEFREWEDENGLPITQRTSFSQTPLTAMARMYLTSRGRQIGRFAWVPTRLAPYVGAGVGAVHYKFKQTGSFVDFQDLGIFDATFESAGWTAVGVVGAGLDFSLDPRVTLNTDVRYQFASAELDQDFIDFTDGLDLNGLQVSVGVHFRF